MFLLILTMLFGCQPRTWETCYTNELLIEDICDLDYSNDQEQVALNSCSYASGSYQTEKCAGHAKNYQNCRLDILLTDPDCDEIAEDISDNCSELQGKLDGCMAN